MDNPRGHTSETRAGQTSNNSIPENAQKVNRNAKKLDGKDYALPRADKITDGAHRFVAEDGQALGIIKEGKNYYIYDYASGKISYAQTKSDINKLLSDIQEQYGTRDISAALPAGTANMNTEVLRSAEKSLQKPNATKVPTVEITENQELSKRILASKKSKYDVIREYLIEQFAGYEFTLSDGRRAVMDNRDAKELSHNANEARTKQLGNLKELVEQARYDHSEYNVDHNKFVDFHYYLVSAKYGKDTYNLWINVGTAKNDGKNHIYSITNKKETPTNYGVAGPVGNQLQSVSSTTIIPENETVVNKNSGNIVESKENSANKGKSDAQTSRIDSVRPDKIHEYLRENVKGYKALSVPNQVMVRAIIRQGRILGIPDADLLLYAKVATRSGVNIVFDKEATYLGKNKDTGEDVYADGFYERGKNQITVNPEGKRSAERLLIHELAHAIFKTTDGAIIAVRGVKNLTQEEKDRITQNYAKLHKNLTEGEISIKITDEQNAHYAEGMLADRAILERLVADKPTLKDKIFNFFKGAATDYADDVKLSAEANKLYRQYKKLFDEFSARNADTNAVERTVRGKSDEREYAVMKSFSEQIDDVINGVHNPRLDIYVSETTTELVNLNFSEGPILMRNSKVKEILDKHPEMSEELLKRIPEAINDPLLIIKSKTHPTESVVLISDIMTSKGEVIIPIWVNQEGNYIDVELGEVSLSTNFVASAYGRDIKSLLEYANKNEGFFYQSPQKERVRQLLARNGLQLSTPLKMSNSTIIISEKSEKSNSFSKKKLEKISNKDFALPDGFDSDKIVVSRGELAKLKANYQGDKVFYKKDVVDALSGIDAMSNLSAEIKNGLANDLWRGYNMRFHAQGYELFTEIMYEKLCAVIQQENDFSLGHDEMAKLETQVADALSGIIAGGKPSEKAKFRNIVESDVNQEMEKLEQSAAYWRAQYNNLDKRAKVIGNLTNAAQSMKNLKLGIFANASEYKSDIFKGSIEKLSNIQWRGNVSVKSTRKIAADLLSWYSKENPLLEYVSDDNSGYFLEDIHSKLEGVANGQKAFTLSELKDLRDIMGYFTKLVKSYNKVFVDNKYVDALPLAKGFVEVADTNTAVGNVGPHNLFVRYMDSFGNPLSLMKLVDRYQDNGFNTFIFNTLQRAGLDAQIAEMKTLEDYEKFMREHKGYEGKLEEAIEYRARKMTRAQLIGLYMTSKREQAQAGLIINGYTYVGADGNSIRVPGWTSEQNISREELAQKVADVQKEIEALLSADDKAYIEVVEAGFEAAKQMKIDRDMQRYGYTNALEGYYYPIRRANTAKSVDTSMKGEIERASNPSFNKDTVQGARQELYIGGVDQVYLRHIHAMTQYSYLSPAIDTFNKLYNLDISGNKNKAVTVKTQTKEAWNYKGKDNTSGEHLGDKYFRKLIEDIQGISAYDEGGKLMAKMRGNYATFALGANPKVWLTQFSSLFASTSMLDYDSVVASFKMDAKDVDTYCSLAQLRNNDNTAVKAQSVVNKLNKTADVLMKPIGWVDRYVVQRLFAACQIQVQKNGGDKVGTDANKIAAGELLERVILETQQNSLATERSGAMRSSSEFMKAITMFSADAMKVTGKVIDSYGEINAIDRRIKLLQKAQKKGATYLDETALGKTTERTDNVANKKISAGMTDAERYEVLKDRYIENIPTAQELSEDIVKSVPEISSWSDIDKHFGSEKRVLIHKIASEFGVFERGEYSNSDIGLSFEFSNGGLRKSFNEQKSNYQSFAKLFSVFGEVIDNAVGIEVHNRNNDGYKPDPSLANVYVLASAFADGDSIIPVKLEVKEFNDKKNKLYVAITLEGIKKAEISAERTSVKEVAYSAHPANISISHLFEKINPVDESFYKYIPVQFKNGEKASTSRSTIAEEIESLKNQKKAAGKQLSRKVQKIERPRS